MKTYHLKEADKQTKWFFIDAQDQTLGRLSSKVASILLGKNDPKFSYNIALQNKVVVTNTDKLKVTGKKLTDKIYYRHTGFPGGLRSETLGNRMSNDSANAFKSSVKGMLPKNKLRDVRIKNLYAYAGNEHPHITHENGKTNK